jgi:ECF sigma factor
MQSENSVTSWIAAVRTGDAFAAEQLWARYFRQLMLQARLRMSNVAKGSYDEEDAALSTFQVLCKKLNEGQYAEIADRQELWQLMLKVLIRKIGRRVKYQTAAKRSPGTTQPNAVSVDELPAPTSQEISQECFDLISSLNDPNLERVALLKFEGYSNEEIALKLQRTRRTVQRMLNLIRDLWEEELIA